MIATTPERLLTLKTAEPFCPFRIELTTGQAFDIRSPRMVKPGRHDFVLFIHDEGEDELDARVHFFGHSVIDRVTTLGCPPY